MNYFLHDYLKTVSLNPSRINFQVSVLMRFSKNQQSHETRIEQMMETHSKLEENIRNHQSSKDRGAPRQRDTRAWAKALSVWNQTDRCMYICMHGFVWRKKWSVFIESAFIVVLLAVTISVAWEWAEQTTQVATLQKSLETSKIYSPLRYIFGPNK